MSAGFARSWTDRSKSASLTTWPNLRFGHEPTAGQSVTGGRSRLYTDRRSCPDDSELYDPIDKIPLAVKSSICSSSPSPAVCASEIRQQLLPKSRSRAREHRHVCCCSRHRHRISKLAETARQARSTLCARQVRSGQVRSGQRRRKADHCGRLSTISATVDSTIPALDFLSLRAWQTGNLSVH